MFKKEQIENKVDMVDKRSYNGHLAIVPTSLFVNQILARPQLRDEKKFKFACQLKKTHKFK